MKFIEIAGTTFAVDAIESVSFQPQGERDGSRTNRLKESDTPGEAGGLMSVTASKADVLTGGFSVSL